MAALVEMLGATLQSKAGPVGTDAALAGSKVVGLYFSAHWCGPCRGFTPQLGAFYDAHAKTVGLEIVFVSSDRDEAGFDSYYGEMTSWLALPYGDRARKDALSRKFKVQGIPTFVLVDVATGATITADARSEVGAHPDAAGFPWRPPTVAETLASLPPLAGKTAPAPLRALDGPLLLYFSAHWCPPCRGFTPQLVEFFAQLKAAHPSANVVFVSSDRDAAAFDDYFASMGADWFALPFAARAEKDALSKAFDVDGIPCLVLLGAPDATGRRALVTKAGRARVADGLIADFPDSWADTPWGDLATTVECRGEDVNSTKALCVLVDGCDAARADAAVSALKAAAEEAAAAPGDPDCLYFYATETAGPVDQVRALCQLSGDVGTATLLLLDIPDNGGYYVQKVAKDATIDAALVANFLANPGGRNQLSG
jgi:nucleoredoxin